jgi:protein-S-isoprenylcysteine O-methyltransferase Ste14
MGLADYVHSVATGSIRRRRLLTPAGLLFFGTSLAVVVAGGLYADRRLGLPRLLPGAPATIVGAVLLVMGSTLCGWCVVRFLRARGTPVPLNPPNELIIGGPYARARNPMLTGVFAALFGIGFLLESTGITLLCAPAYVLLHIAELKWVEEPELVRRFGAAYTRYREQVPMFIPRLHRGHRRTPPRDEA